MAILLKAKDEDGKEGIVNAFDYYINKCSIMDFQYPNGEFTPKCRENITPIDLVCGNCGD